MPVGLENKPNSERLQGHIQICRGVHLKQQKYYFLPQHKFLHIRFGEGQSIPLWAKYPCLAPPGILEELGCNWRSRDALASIQSISLEDRAFMCSGTHSCHMSQTTYLSGTFFFATEISQ